MSIAPPAFPSRKLLLPPLITLALLASLSIGQWLGHEWSAHGDGLILGALFQLSAVVVCIYELVVMPKAIAALRSRPANNTPLNLACLWVTGLFLAACAAWLAWLIFS